MTRVVKHKHGLELSSGNIWSGFFKGPNAGEWRATVSAEDYLFDTRIGPLIRTPAQQLMWWDHPQTGITEIHPYMREWLKKEIGEFGIKWECNGAMGDVSEILFATRADAMKFVNRIKSLLDGMRFE